MGLILFLFGQWLLLINFALAGLSITGPDSLNFGSIALDVTKTTIMGDFCVYDSDTTTHDYQMTATGDISYDSNNFILRGNDGTVLPIKLLWHASRVPSGFVELKNNIPSQKFQDISTYINCNGANNAKLKLIVDKLALDNATANNYNGSFSLLVDSDSKPGVRPNLTFVVSLSKPSQVIITTADTLNLPPTTPPTSTIISAYNSACVYTTPRSRYRIKALGILPSGTGVDFSLKSGNCQIPYTINWYENNGVIGSGVPLNRDKFITSTTFGASKLNCGGISNYNASYKVMVQGNDINAVNAGTYTDTLTLIVAPP